MTAGSVTLTIAGLALAYADRYLVPASLTGWTISNVSSQLVNVAVPVTGSSLRPGGRRTELAGCSAMDQDRGPTASVLITAVGWRGNTACLGTLCGQRVHQGAAWTTEGTKSMVRSNLLYGMDSGHPVSIAGEAKWTGRT